MNKCKKKIGLVVKSIEVPQINFNSTTMCTHTKLNKGENSIAVTMWI